MAGMRHEFGSPEEPGVLTPTIPVDIGVRSRQERILAGMAQCCAEKTFSATTIADVVTSASISRATFYKHFAGKRECFDASVAFFTAQLQAAATEAYIDNVGSATDALRNAATAVLELLAANPAYARLILVEAPLVEPALLDPIRKLLIEAMTAEWGSTGDSGPSPQIAFGSAQVLMASFLSSDRLAQFPELLPEIVYIALLPFIGQEKALAQAKLAK
jgi:AcrR family transcriptional regulator